MHTITSGAPTADEAAAIAAVAALLIAEGAAAAAAPAVGPAAESRWRQAGRLISQGLAATRAPADPRWATIERLRRAGRGGSGVVGL